MGDQEAYNAKLQNLQKFIPFLNNMMNELKAKGNREAQFTKIQSLHTMITDKKKKLKLETLNRCEEVLNNLYYKVNPQLKKSPAPHETPRSPSPQKDNFILNNAPITIPTEKIATSRLGPLSSHESHPPKVDIYSSAAESLAKASKIKKERRDSDTVKPLISIDDLNTLQDDVNEKINSVQLSNASISELTELKQKLFLKLKVDEINSAMAAKTKSPKKKKSPEKSKHKEGKEKSPKESKHSKELIFNDDSSNVLTGIDKKMAEEKKKLLEKVEKDQTQPKDHSEKRNSKESESRPKEERADTDVVDVDLTSDSAHLPSSSPPPSQAFKRLADKYNPKPRKSSIEAPEIDKVVSDIIDKNMKISPLRAPTEIIARVPEPVPPPASLVRLTMDAPKPHQEKKVELPPILQKMFNPKPPLPNLTNIVVRDNQRTMISPPLLSPPVQNQFYPQNRNTLMPNPQVPIAAVNQVQINMNFDQTMIRTQFHNQNAPIFERRPQVRPQFPPQDLGVMNQPQPLMSGNFYNPYGQNSQMGHYNQFPQDQRGYPMDNYNYDAPPLLQPEVGGFYEEKPVFNRGWPDQQHWNNSRDPRSYREYREMKEKEAARDPRVNRDFRNSVRDPRMPREEEPPSTSVRDPRSARWNPRDEARDPRVNRERWDPRQEAKEIKTDKWTAKGDPRESKVGGIREDKDKHEEDRRRERSEETRSKNIADKVANRSKSLPRPNEPKTLQPPPKKLESKFDKVYSRTGEGLTKEEDTFTSPLDSLYSGKPQSKTGLGYGFQTFKIPKIRKSKPEPPPKSKSIEKLSETTRLSKENDKEDETPTEEAEIDHVSSDENAESDNTEVVPKKVKEVKKNIKSGKAETERSRRVRKPRRKIIDDDSDEEESLPKEVKEPVKVASPKVVSKKTPEKVTKKKLTERKPKETAKSKECKSKATKPAEKVKSTRSSPRIVSKIANLIDNDSDSDGDMLDSNIDSTNDFEEEVTSTMPDITKESTAEESKNDLFDKLKNEDASKKKIETKPKVIKTHEKEASKPIDEVHNEPEMPSLPSHDEVKMEEKPVLIEKTPVEAASTSKEQVEEKVQVVVTEKIEEVVPAKIQEVVPQKVQEIAPEKVEEVAQEKLQEVVAAKVQEVIPEKAQEVAPKKVEEVAAEKVEEVQKVPEISTEKVTEVSTEKVQEVATEKVQEVAAEKVQEVATEKVQQVAVEKPVEPKQEPGEQNILAHFFENLLKSKNKQDKKTALFSLIETFADSFSDRELQKISKIIKTDHTDDKSSSDEEEKKDTKKTEDAIAKEETSSIADSEPPPEIPELNKSLEKSETDSEKMPEQESKWEEPKDSVVVSVGERIKSRRRNPPPKRKQKSELDLLHEDIQEMFIRDGILTATGQRMCRILRNDPNALSPAKPEVPAPSTQEEQKKPPRKKPGPKSKKEKELESMKTMKVIISKMPETVTKRKLRSSLTKKDVSNETNESSESESSDEEKTEEDEAKSQTSEVPQGKPRAKKRRTNTWASGFIPKNKKKKQLQKSDSKDESDKEEDDDDKSFVEPDKNYYIDPSGKKMMSCKLCDHQGINMSHHYKTCHPNSEVLCSRLEPSVAKTSIKHAIENAVKLNSIASITSKMRGCSNKYTYSCRMCGFSTSAFPLMFYEHVTTHTGEYRHSCGLCPFTGASGKSLHKHFATVHPDVERKATRRQYNLPIIFGYMCGECNFVQLHEKTVEEHANIFHLGDKPKIYRIDMSTAHHPAYDSVPVKPEEPDMPVLKKATLKKKPGPKPKNAPALIPDEIDTKPAPKSKKKVKKQSTVPDRDDMTSDTENEAIPTPVYKKPGPKSKTVNVQVKPRRQLKRQVSKSSEVASETSDDESGSRRNSVTKRRTNSVSSDANSEMSTGATNQREKRFLEENKLADVTIEGRGRAAKEKASAKLKSLMEEVNNLNMKSPAKGGKAAAKKPDTPLTSTTTTSTTMSESESTPKIESTESEPSDDDNDNTENDSSFFQEDDEINKKNDSSTLNVFTCERDILQEERIIEEERLKKMNELNKSIGSRTSKLDFIERLSTRLKDDEEVKIKEEPNDDAMAETQSAVENIPPSSSVQSKISNDLVSNSKKPFLEEDLQLPPPSTLAFKQNKNNTLFSDMIQKLQGSLQTREMNEGSQHDEDSSNSDNIQKSEICGFVVFHKTTLNNIIFECTYKDCRYQSNDEMIFRVHCQKSHPEANLIKNALCEKCAKNVVIEPNKFTLETMFDHLYKHMVESEVMDEFEGMTLLQKNVLSGYLSVHIYEKGILFECCVENCSFKSKDKEVFREHCQRAHVFNIMSTLCDKCGEGIIARRGMLLESVFNHVLLKHSVLEEIPKPPTKVIRLRKLSGDSLSVKKENEEKDVVESEEAAVSVAQLEFSPDNPFGFKIADVVSLAENEEAVASIIGDNNPPPLTLIAPKQSSVAQPNQLIVKEVKMTPTEASAPKKTAKALEKFLHNPGDLYKCPHFYCYFTTNIRDLMERHLTAHKWEPKVMIPCIYCEMKTPWEHIPMHIYIRHAHCKFACAYCLYRAVSKDYVVIHQDVCHNGKEYSVISLPVHKEKRFAVTDVKLDPRTLCKPYQCIERDMNFLYENEFSYHLMMCHGGKSVTQCGYFDCTAMVPNTMLPLHWQTEHGVSRLQCAHCRHNGTKDAPKLVEHFALHHPSFSFEYFVRVLPKVDPNHLLKWSNEAFSKLPRWTTINEVKSKKPLTIPPPPEPVAAVTSISPKKLVIVPSTALNILTTLSSSPKTYVSPKMATTIAKPLTPSKIVTSKKVPFVVSNNKETSKQITPISISNEMMDLLKAVEEDSVSEPIIENLSDSNSQDSVAPVEHIELASTDINNDISVQPDVDPLSIDTQSVPTDPLSAVTTTSDDESDCNMTVDSSASNAKKKKTGLSSYDLYRCGRCCLSFAEVKAFKSHAMSSVSCRMESGKPFKCAHCERMLRTAQRLVEHIKTHGVLRFNCSLCTGSFSSLLQVKGHMKFRHSITQITCVSVDPNKNDLEADKFVVRPVQVIPKEKISVDKNATEANVVDELVFTPDQIDKIPIRQIFSTAVKCGLCHYANKVRINIVRHLQMHLEEKQVPDSAPVNPVPCLEKNEKMFDKMTNLAASSFDGRMGGKKSETKIENEEKLPEFVPSHRKYVCCAKGCNYLCPEEGNLRHHLIALHSDETEFTCAHCNQQLTPPDADNLMKHFRLHGLHLYKCNLCSFVHYLKHKVEKHFADKHPDFNVKVITVRYMESEPNTDDRSVSPSPALIVQTNKKPWRCCMCKYRCGNEDDIKIHISSKHDIDFQLKCTLCNYKSDERSSFDSHFKETHPKNDVDIIYVYRKVEEEQQTVEEHFDTTPLWSRDKPRVRHIRGILFDESSPQATKSPKKVTKSNQRGTVTPPPQSVSPSPSTSSNKSDILFNLMKSIDAVASGNDSSSTHNLENVTATEITNETVEDVATNQQSDDDVQEIADNSVIVIDDEDDVPQSKPNDVTNSPMNKSLKRKNLEDGEVAPKVIKTEEEVIDLDSTPDYDMDTEFGPKRLSEEYGSFGSPHNKQLKCPKCQQFKSKRIADFIFHILKDFKEFRFHCKACRDESITYKYMLDHIRLHRADESSIIHLNLNKKLEVWIQMVIREQSLQVLVNNPRIRLLPGDITKNSPDSVTCDYCDKCFRDLDFYEHMFVHWSEKPFGCDYCNFQAFTEDEIKVHSKYSHSKWAPKITKKGPTVLEAMKKSDELHKKQADNVVPMPKKLKKEEKTSKEEVPVGESDEDLMIVSNVEGDEGDIFGCEYCEYVGNNFAEMSGHMIEYHPSTMHKYHRITKDSENVIHHMSCNKCIFVNSELKIRKHFAEKHKGEVFMPYRFICVECTAPFLQLRVFRQHANLKHPNKKPLYKNVISLAQNRKEHNQGKKLKIFNCPKCEYQNINSSANNVKQHLRTHIRAYKCEICGAFFKTTALGSAHSRKEHEGETESIVLDQSKQDDFEASYLTAVRNAENYDDSQAIIAVKKTARKSTSASRRYVSIEEEEFSYYGNEPEEVDLSDIKTMVDIDDVEVNLTAEQLSKMMDLNPFVQVVDLKHSEREENSFDDNRLVIDESMGEGDNGGDSDIFDVDSFMN